MVGSVSIGDGACHVQQHTFRVASLLESFQECEHSNSVCLRFRGRNKGSDDFSFDDCAESGSWMTGFVMEEILWIGGLFVWLNVQYSSGVEAVALVKFFPDPEM